MYTILIVDDEANLLEVLAVALENMGYGTVTAETAEEALAVLEEREVHLVLSDLRLPGLSGRELMEKVKAANPDLPVVIMTAYASLKEAVEIIKEGAFDYTVKPFELAALEFPGDSHRLAAVHGNFGHARITALFVIVRTCAKSRHGQRCTEQCLPKIYYFHRVEC